jgi:hypothetical protein
MHGDQDAVIFETRSIADQISTRMLSVSKLARSLRIGTPRLYQWLAEAGCPLVTSIGRFPLPDRHLLEERVRQCREVRGIHCGSHDTAQSIALPGQSPPSHTVYEMLHRLPRPVDRPPCVHNHRFVARYVDYLWHTDLHEKQMFDERTGGASRMDLIAFLGTPHASSCTIV